MKEFSERLKAARKSAKLGQTKLASLLDVSNGSVGNWETGRNIPLPDTLRKLSDVLNVSVSHLLGDDAPHLQETAPPYQAQFHLACLSDKELAILYSTKSRELADIPAESSGDLLDSLQALRAEIEKRKTKGEP